MTEVRVTTLITLLLLLLLLDGLQVHSGTAEVFLGYAELNELGESLAELSEEDLLIFGVSLGMWPESLVCCESHVGVPGNIEITQTRN